MSGDASKNIWNDDQNFPSFSDGKVCICVTFLHCKTLHVSGFGKYERAHDTHMGLAYEVAMCAATLHVFLAFAYLYIQCMVPS